MTPPQDKFLFVRTEDFYPNPAEAAKRGLQAGTIGFVTTKKALDDIILSGKGRLLTKDEYADLSEKESIDRETAKDEKDKTGKKFTSFYEDEEILAEEIYPASGVVNFAIYDKKSGKVTYGLPSSDIQPIPEDGALVEGAVLLPTAAEECGDIVQLKEDIQAHIHKYLDVGKDYESFATCYILLSWVYDKLTTVCYLRAFGDTGCGKSRFLDVIGRLCYKPIMASGCITPAPIYRMLKKWKGTIILDEADFKNSDEYNEVVTILNCGFELGRPIIRCHKDSPDDIQILPCFSPKVLATRRRFKDPALESRCLTETLRETSRTDIPPILPMSFYDEGMRLRNRLLMFRFRCRDKVNPDDIQHIDLGDVEPRLKQATASFAVLLSSVDGLLEDFKEFLRGFNRELIEQRSETPEGLVVNAIFSLSQTGGVPPYDGTLGADGTKFDPSITSKKIVERLKETGVELTPQKVGGILRTLGLETEQFRRGDEKGRFLKWDASRLETLRRRYVPSVPNVPTIEGTASNLGQDIKHLDELAGGELKEPYPEGIGHTPQMTADLARKKDGQQ